MYSWHPGFRDVVTERCQLPCLRTNKNDEIGLINDPVGNGVAHGSTHAKDERMCFLQDKGVSHHLCFTCWIKSPATISGSPIKVERRICSPTRK